ncbi:MAG: class I SAM-dependent rRNA methyltransferase [Gammaproteobacteria bacterium]
MKSENELIRLNKNADRRIREGHSWIYSNEIDTRSASLKDFEPGQLVDVVNSQDKWLGRGYINPNSLICIRLLSRDKSIDIDRSSGAVPDLVELEEGDCRFQVSLTEGQKTGWFFDQAANRQKMLEYVSGKTVLDVCSYVGAWSVQAAKAGATEVTAVDVSAKALDAAHYNAELNNVADKLVLIEGDAFDAMRELKQENHRYDVVILDPPAFIKKRKDIKQGLIAYKRLNELAVRLVNNDGILISASCSHHLSGQDLVKTLQQAARHNDRWLQILEEGKQGIDHPVHPAIPETSYLKAYYCRVLRN